MLKVIFFSSEKQKKFGVSKVVEDILKNLDKKINAKFSNDILDIFFLCPDIVHIHGCWRLNLLFVFLISKIKGIKVIISPHGMIDPYSINQKKFKKLIAWYLYQKYIFLKSDLVIVNSNLEKKNLIKSLKFFKKIRIIPHGTQINNKLNINKKNNQKINFVYFSRVHPSKNLMGLVEIWTNDIFFKKHILHLYGEVIDKNYFQTIKKIIKKYPNIKYKGTIRSNTLKTLSKYDIFIHPSKSENFGLVILEALSSGLFLIINKNLDWRILENKGFARLINFNNKELKNCIIYLEKLYPKLRGVNFKKSMINYVKVNYNWSKIVSKYEKEYKTLI